MSANNFILIRQYKRNKFSVAIKDVDTLNGRTIKYFEDLESAIRFANAILGHYDIEYGLHIKLLDKKTSTS